MTDLAAFVYSLKLGSMTLCNCIANETDVVFKNQGVSGWLSNLELLVGAGQEVLV